jgi:hypothetical protein
VEVTMETQAVGEQVRAEKSRLGSQCGLIMALLWTGRQSNATLAKHALKYSGRISELRKKEHDIRVVERNYETGLVWYALFVDGREIQ